MSQTIKDKHKSWEEDKQCATALVQEKLAESLASCATGIKPSQSALSRGDFLSQKSPNENIDKCKEELESWRTGEEYTNGRNSQSPNGIVNPAKIKTERLSDIPISMNGSNIDDPISSKHSVLQGEGWGGRTSEEDDAAVAHPRTPAISRAPPARDVRCARADARRRGR